MRHNLNKWEIEATHDSCEYDQYQKIDDNHYQNSNGKHPILKELLNKINKYARWILKINTITLVTEV